jgi:hypothetical protein
LPIRAPEEPRRPKEADEEEQDVERGVAVVDFYI